jgi:dUTP pyrophosphatase
MESDKVNDYLNRLKNLDDQMDKLFTEVESDEKLNDDINLIKNLTSIISELETDVKKGSKITDYYSDDNFLDIRIKKLHANAVIPTYSKHGDAGMDLTITSIIENSNDKIKYGYGIAIEIPEGYVGLVFPRSSISKKNLLLTNSVGVLDSGYRGELMSVFYKTKYDDSIVYDIGDRGAQLLILPYPKIKFIVSEELNKTERNDGGFGSSGN